MRHLPKLLLLLVPIVVLGVACPSVAGARPVAHAASFLPKWPKDYADSPCSKSNLKNYIKDAEGANGPGEAWFLSTVAFCSLPLSEECLAQQYNRGHNVHVPFYTNRTFYRHCQEAYRLLRSRRKAARARRAGTSACDIIGWASIIAGPFIPAESLAVKAGTIVFGAALKLSCG